MNHAELYLLFNSHAQISFHFLYPIFQDLPVTFLELRERDKSRNIETSSPSIIGIFKLYKYMHVYICSVYSIIDYIANVFNEHWKPKLLECF